VPVDVLEQAAAVPAIIVIARANHTVLTRQTLRLDAIADAIVTEVPGA
jgi:hypothetical protein